MCDLVDDVDTVGEMLDKSTIKVHAVSLLPYVQVVVRIVEVIHPMIVRSPIFQQLKDSSAIITLRYKSA